MHSPLLPFLGAALLGLVAADMSGADPSPVSCSTCYSENLAERTTVFVIPVSSSTGIVAATATSFNTAMPTVAATATSFNTAMPTVVRVSSTVFSTSDNTAIARGWENITRHDMVNTTMFVNNPWVRRPYSITSGVSKPEATGSTVAAFAASVNNVAGVDEIPSASPLPNNTVMVSCVSLSVVASSSAVNNCQASITQIIPDTVTPPWHPASSTTTHTGNVSSYIDGTAAMAVASVSCACVCVCAAAAAVVTDVPPFANTLTHWGPTVGTLLTIGKDGLDMVLGAIHVAIAWKQLKALRQINGRLQQ